MARTPDRYGRFYGEATGSVEDLHPAIFTDRRNKFRVRAERDGSGRWRAIIEARRRPRPWSELVTSQYKYDSKQSALEAGRAKLAELKGGGK